MELSYKRVSISLHDIIPVKTIGRVYTYFFMPKIDTDEIIAMEDTHITVRGYRRRTTIPSGIFRFLKLKDGDVIRWIAIKDGTIFVSKLEK
jgi:hypothetical protein